MDPQGMLYGALNSSKIDEMVLSPFERHCVLNSCVQQQWQSSGPGRLQRKEAITKFPKKQH
jgi:hypothetical protein